MSSDLAAGVPRPKRLPAKPLLAAALGGRGSRSGGSRRWRPRLAVGVDATPAIRPSAGRCRLGDAGPGIRRCRHDVGACVPGRRRPTRPLVDLAMVARHGAAGRRRTSAMSPCAARDAARGRRAGRSLRLGRGVAGRRAWLLTGGPPRGELRPGGRCRGGCARRSRSAGNSDRPSGAASAGVTVRRPAAGAGAGRPRAGRAGPGHRLVSVAAPLMLFMVVAAPVLAVVAGSPPGPGTSAARRPHHDRARHRRRSRSP